MTRLLLLALVAVASVGTASAQDWQVVWSDEFDTDGAPDPVKWGYDLGGGGWGNQELQRYTDRRENSRVENGMLVIEAREESLGGNAYTSARLVTRDKASWTYGRMEARMKMPEGQGLWPAFWMLAEDSPYGNWPFSGEIDIMEFLGNNTQRVLGTLHYGGGTYNPCRANRGAVQGHCYSGSDFDLEEGSFSDEFHTFAVEWTPRQIRWLVDGEVWQTQSYWYSGAAPPFSSFNPEPFDQPFHILLNVAVGGQLPGNPDATTTFPQRLEVDYVRVYKDANAAPTITLDGPTSGTTVEAGSTVALAATASEGATVEFLQADGLLGTDTEAPYALDVAGVADGCYRLSARATNDAGYVTETEPVDLVVGAGCPEGSQWPFLMVPASIPGVVEAEHYDLGGTGVAYRDLNDTNSGGGIRQQEGVDVQASADAGGGYDVTNTTSREWITYTVDVAEAARYRVTARAVSSDPAALKLSLDGADLTGDAEIPATGRAYRDAVLGDVDLPAGRHVLRVDVRTGGFSLNRLTFATAPSTAADDGVEAGSLDLRLSPNPATDRIEVAYRLAAPGRADVSVFDALGRRVAVLASGPTTAGEHRATLAVNALPPGLYVCVLTTEQGQTSERVAVVR